MIKSRILTAIALSLMFLSCQNHTEEGKQAHRNIEEENEQNVNDTGIYNYSCNNNINAIPQDVREYGLEYLYSTTKWFLYCYNCDRTIRIMDDDNDTVNRITYGEIDICLGILKLSNDTVQMLFRFTYDGKVIRAPREDLSEYIGAIFYNKNDSKISRFFVVDHKVQLGAVGTISNNPPEGYTDKRLYVPLQPDVIKYIRKNKDKLNTWFRQHHWKKLIRVSIIL